MILVQSGTPYYIDIRCDCTSHLPPPPKPALLRSMPTPCSFTLSFAPGCSDLGFCLHNPCPKGALLMARPLNLVSHQLSGNAKEIKLIILDP